MNPSTVLIQKIQSEISGILSPYFDEGRHLTLGLSDIQYFRIKEKVYTLVFQDLIELASKDPAAQNNAEYVLKTYSSFKAVLSYRIANNIFRCESINDLLRKEYASRIMEDAKKSTGIEIHYAANIDVPFVIDHGIGTVIGETCDIGKNCYILQKVVLGSKKISGNPLGKRHPTLKDNVEVGSFSRIFGPVTIGENVKISPYSIILEDIPDDHNVMIMNQLQITTSKNNEMLKVYGVVPQTDNSVLIYLNRTENISVELVDDEYKPLKFITLSGFETSRTFIKVFFDRVHGNTSSKVNVKLIDGEYVTYILNPSGIRDCIAN